MKYLLQAIEAKRATISLNDTDLRKLLTEVRKGRDEREEFLESIDRIITELRNYTEHSTAFLSKVSKRDAPDYYDVIKHPMDLGTMQKKVKAGQYKSKKQFAHDLDLIWDNCLLYNSDPTHPLRRNVHFMRKKANHLLEFISDKSDVKDALIQWEVNESAMAATQQPQPPSIATAHPTDSPDKDPTTTTTTQPGTQEPAAVSLNKQGSRFAASAALATSSSSSSVAAAGRQNRKNVPLDQLPAFIRQPEHMSLFSKLDASIAALESAALPSLDQSAGPSSRPMLAPPPSAMSVDKLMSTLGNLAEQFPLDPLSATLGSIFKPPSAKGKERATPESARGSRAPSDTGAPDASVSDRPSLAPARESPFDASAAWWSACASDDLMSSALPALPHSQRLAPPSPEERARKRRRTLLHLPPTQRPGLQGLVARNIRTIHKVQETHAKFLSLAHVVENEAPIPAYLTNVSSDEESDDYPSADELSDDELSAARAGFDRDGDGDGDGDKHDHDHDHDGAHRRRRIYRHEPFTNPYARISPASARAQISWNAQSLLAHHGFEGAHRAAADVLTNVMAEFLMNMGRTLRIYADRYARKMSAEEMILHSLLESGNTDVSGLESYIRDHVERYGAKMSDLLRKLRQSYRDQLQSTTDRAVVLDDEALDAEALVSGHFAEDLGDDFFGFKELGLDRELGVAGLTVPSRLFHGRGPARAAAAARGYVLTIPTPYSPHRLCTDSLGCGRVEKEPELPYPPPPPYVPLTASGITAQIGLLRPWYSEKLRNSQDDTIPDEEQDKPRYKVPPNGKMPRRTLWSARATAPESQPTVAAAATAATAATTAPVSGPGSKKKGSAA